MDYEEQILKRLAEKYRRSKKDAGTNKNQRRTPVKPSELYPKYYDNDGDLEIIEEIGEAVRRCEERGFVSHEMAGNGFGYEIAAVYLNDSRIAEVEQYLRDNYGYESKEDKLARAREIIGKYRDRSPAAACECAKMQSEVERRRVPKDLEQKEDLLKALAFVENNREELYIREASMLIYGSSKYFEETTLDAVCRILREYSGEPCREDEMPDEILEQYHIRKETQHLCVKGDCILYIEGRKVELGMFQMGVEFAAEELPKISRVEVRGEEFLTIENRTSYLRYPAKNAVVFYLGGYANRFQRDFLKMVYRDNPGLTWRHFGDLDAGGFLIHEQLVRITGIPFEMKYMSIKELRDERFTPCLMKLKDTDRARLQGLLEKGAYRETAAYMLEKGIKLEQEIISYYLGME